MIYTYIAYDIHNYYISIFFINHFQLFTWNGYGGYMKWWVGPSVCHTETVQASNVTWLFMLMSMHVVWTLFERLPPLFGCLYVRYLCLQTRLFSPVSVASCVYVTEHMLIDIYYYFIICNNVLHLTRAACGGCFVTPVILLVVNCFRNNSDNDEFGSSFLTICSMFCLRYIRVRSFTH